MFFGDMCFIMLIIRYGFPVSTLNFPARELEPFVLQFRNLPDIHAFYLEDLT